ncbi:MAG: hypothetical protein ACI81P_001766 [Neolewinella sp.]|jgi:hypothetical protein
MQRIFKRSENKSVRSKTSKLFIRRPYAIKNPTMPKQAGQFIRAMLKRDPRNKAKGLGTIPKLQVLMCKDSGGV